MSVKLMGEVWELDLAHNHQSVALALADHGKDDGTSIYPSVEHVAWKTGYSERQVQRIIRELVVAGLLIKVAEAGGHRPVEYRMDTTAVPPKPPWRGVKSPGRQSDTPASNVAPGVTNWPSRGDIAVAPEPVEPSNNRGASNEAPVSAEPTPDALEEQVGELCTFMSDELRKHHGVAASSQQYLPATGWRAACLSLLDDQGYTPEQLRYAINWVLGHHYWSRRVMSMTRLRGEMPEIAKELKQQREQRNARQHLRAVDGGDSVLAGYPPEARARLERTARRMGCTVEDLLSRSSRVPADRQLASASGSAGAV